MTPNQFDVTHISSIDGRVRVELEYWKYRNTKARRTIDLPWTTIETLVEEAAISGELVHASLGNYYVLHMQ